VGSKLDFIGTDRWGRGAGCYPTVDEHMVEGKKVFWGHVVRRGGKRSLEKGRKNWERQSLRISVIMWMKEKETLPFFFPPPPPCEVGISGDGEWTLSGVGCRRRDNKNSFFFGGGCQRLPTILALKMATAMSAKTLDNFQQSTWIILEIGNYNISLNIAI
jgi:hypothetical protein